jgi:hypothetical protein
LLEQEAKRNKAATDTLRDSPLHKEVEFAVAPVAEHDQILGGVIAEQTSRLDVMLLKTVWTPVVLTAPSISVQHPPAELSVGIRAQAKPRPFVSQGIHDAFRTSARNSSKDFKPPELSREKYRSGALKTTALP